MNCSENNSSMNFDLKDLNAIIRIPSLYKSVDEKEIGRIINKENDFQFRDELLAFIIQNPNDNVLIDTVNPYKYILVSSITPYIVIDSNSFYYTIDHERSISCSKPNNDSTYYVGSKMGIIGNFKFIESKYQRAREGRQRIGYTYIISSEAKTIGISFYSPEIQDVRQYINTIKKK
jgi:hypothetical protein